MRRGAPAGAVREQRFRYGDRSIVKTARWRGRRSGGGAGAVPAGIGFPVAVPTYSIFNIFFRTGGARKMRAARGASLQGGPSLARRTIHRGQAPALACSFDYATISVPQSLFPHRTARRAAAQVLATYCIRQYVRWVTGNSIVVIISIYDRLPGPGRGSTSPKLAPRRARRRGTGTTISVRRS